MRTGSSCFCEARTYSASCPGCGALGSLRPDIVWFGEMPYRMDEVYAALLEWIVDGTLGPGERVRDKELAEALGVSRTPVREALQRLEDAGLVETSASRWTRVASLDVAQAEQVYPVVWSLEALAVELAGRDLSDEDLCEME